MYHYTESGLDYVYLINGYQESDTPYGKAVSIDNVESLHRLIGTSVSRSTSNIKPEEVRFLRVEMELSQKDLGQWISVDAQTIARWEKGETEIPGPAERLLKALYLDFIKEGSNVREICERLAELDQHEPVAEVRFEDVDGEWRIAA